MNKRQRKKKAKKFVNSPNSTFAYVDTEPSLTLEKLKAAVDMMSYKPNENHKMTFLSNPSNDNNPFYQQYVMGVDFAKEKDYSAFICGSYSIQHECPICEKEEQMTLQDLVNRINKLRRNLNQGLDDIWIHSRPSSSGGGTTMEIRCGVASNGKLLAKSTNGGALNWFIKGMLTSFQNEAAPSISGFNAQLAAITRSNYTRIIEKED